MFDISISLALVIVTSILCVILFSVLESQWKNAPPGPSGLPIVGNLLQLGRANEPLELIQEWKEKYGNVVGIHLGNYRVVILSGYDTIKEAFSMTEFSGRPLLKPFEAVTGKEKRGLVLSEGEQWVEQRRFALRNLRDFGFGKRSMESFIQEDITDLIESFKKLEREPFVPHRLFSTAVVRSLWNIISGERFTYGDPRFQSILDRLHGIISTTSITGPAFFMPWIPTLFPEWSGWNSFVATVSDVKNLIRGYIVEHKKTFQSDNIRDYIDVYLKEIQSTKDPKSSFHEVNGNQHLLIGIMNLFGAGSETTSQTIVWTLLYLIKYPNVQETLFQEIKSVIGLSRLPSLEDRNSCPYALAVMEETFRISSLLPLGVFHSNSMSDVKFRGYNIPKNTLVLANVYGVHHDKKVWENPDVFRPERFLSADNRKKLVNGNGPVIPFLVGKRACLGEVLARNNYFLYLTTLIQKFEFGSSADFKIEANPGLTRTPKACKILIKERML